MFILIPLIFLFGFLFIRYAPIVIFVCCVGCDLFMVFFGTLFLIDPYMAKISGGKFGNGVLDLLSAIILTVVYIVLYLMFSQKKKLRIPFIIWNVALSFYGSYYMYEAFAYLILPIFGIKGTAVMPIFKWQTINVFVYYLTIFLMGIFVTKFRLDFTDEKLEEYASE